MHITNFICSDNVRYSIWYYLKWRSNNLNSVYPFVALIVTNIIRTIIRQVHWGIVGVRFDGHTGKLGKLVCTQDENRNVGISGWRGKPRGSRIPRYRIYETPRWISQLWSTSCASDEAWILYDLPFPSRFSITAYFEPLMCTTTYADWFPCTYHGSE